MSTMEQHLKNIKISLGQMIEVDQPEVGLLRSQRESFKNIIKLATLQDTVQGQEDAVFASGLCMLENKIDRVEIISQNQQQTLYSNRMDWNNVRYFFGDLAYSISVLESVYKLAKFLENLCLKQDQINSHDLKERAEKFKMEAKFKFREEHPLLRGKFDLNDSFFDASQNWFKQHNTELVVDMVRQQFKKHMHETDPEKIQKMKDNAARGLINHILYESEKMSGRKFSSKS